MRTTWGGAVLRKDESDSGTCRCGKGSVTGQRLVGRTPRKARRTPGKTGKRRREQASCLSCARGRTVSGLWGGKGGAGPGEADYMNASHGRTAGGAGSPSARRACRNNAAGLTRGIAPVVFVQQKQRDYRALGHPAEITEGHDHPAQKRNQEIDRETLLTSNTSWRSLRPTCALSSGAARRPPPFFRLRPLLPVPPFSVDVLLGSALLCLAKQSPNTSQTHLQSPVSQPTVCSGLPSVCCTSSTLRAMTQIVQS